LREQIHVYLSDDEVEFFKNRAKKYGLIYGERGSIGKLLLKLLEAEKKFDILTWVFDQPKVKDELLESKVKFEVAKQIKAVEEKSYKEGFEDGKAQADKELNNIRIKLNKELAEISKLKKEIAEKRIKKIYIYTIPSCFGQQYSDRCLRCDYQTSQKCHEFKELKKNLEILAGAK